jgi:hypothetical protein
MQNLAGLSAYASYLLKVARLCRAGAGQARAESATNPALSPRREPRLPNHPGRPSALRRRSANANRGASWRCSRDTPGFPRVAAWRHSARGFLIVFAFAFAAAFVGYGLSRWHGSDYSAWEELAASLGIRDLPRFVRVAYIHNASYLGGLVGLVAAIIYLRRLKTTERAVQAEKSLFRLVVLPGESP